ncbi:MAG: hypothetical protein KF894_32335 [Labilithrix sp.]|nr:hypothetical protein [Labilithrix sp.]
MTTSGPDPISNILGWLSIALALIGAFQALFFAGIVFTFEALATRRQAPLPPAAGEPEPRPA